LSSGFTREGNSAAIAGSSKLDRARPGAAGFLQKQAGDAKDLYMEALKLWKAS
jgi:hypothetical protein